MNMMKLYDLGSEKFPPGVKEVTVRMPLIEALVFEGNHVKLWSGAYCFDLELKGSTDKPIFDPPFTVKVEP